MYRKKVKPEAVPIPESELPMLEMVCYTVRTLTTVQYSVHAAVIHQCKCGRLVILCKNCGQLLQGQLPGERRKSALPHRPHLIFIGGTYWQDRFHSIWATDIMIFNTNF